MQKMRKNGIKAILSILVMFIFLAIFASIAVAATETGMPWESPLKKILDSISGPVAQILGTLAIIMTGVGWAFSEEGSLIKKGMSIVFGLSIAFTASSFILPMLGFAGGVAF